MTNNADNRSVATDALETLGTIIGDGAGRDAIHLAVEPVIAAHMLRPGEDVGFVDGGVGICDKPVGIVDPFLKVPVHKGERFWLVVYPRQITSLRHVWTHPAFETPAAAVSAAKASSKEESEKWLREFIADATYAPYENVVAEALRSDSWDDAYLTVNGYDAHGEIPDEFWDHLEIVTGKKTARRATYFSCSC